jgi:excisionase family DNA binding protein|tara:strand:- start:192 stop:470 length:279 start_codon:yes stop_codon:yes gene_type:complete
MENSILLQNLSQDDLTLIIKEGVKSQLEDFKENLTSHISDELLTREEACMLLKVDLSTLWRWTNKGTVTAYGIGSRRFYKKEELMSSLIKLD